MLPAAGDAAASDVHAALSSSPVRGTTGAEDQKWQSNWRNQRLQSPPAAVACPAVPLPQPRVALSSRSQRVRQVLMPAESRSTVGAVWCGCGWESRVGRRVNWSDWSCTPIAAVSFPRISFTWSSRSANPFRSKRRSGSTPTYSSCVFAAVAQFLLRFRLDRGTRQAAVRDRFSFLCSLRNPSGPCVDRCVVIDSSWQFPTLLQSWARRLVKNKSKEGDAQEYALKNIHRNPLLWCL